MQNAYALSINNLIEQMRDAAARALDPSLRYSNEPDAVMYGKIIMLDVIAEPHYGSTDLSDDESKSLSAAGREIERAFNHLYPIIFPAD